MDAERDHSLVVELDQILTLGVVDLDAAGEAPGKLRQDDVLELSLARSAPEPCGDEEGLTLKGDADSLELGDGCGERERTRLALGARDRQGGGADHHRDAGPPREGLLLRVAP